MNFDFVSDQQDSWPDSKLHPIEFNIEKTILFKLFQKYLKNNLFTQIAVITQNFLKPLVKSLYSDDTSESSALFLIAGNNKT